MTHKEDIAVLTALRDETEHAGYSGWSYRCTPGQIAALTRAITLYAALDAATGEEARALLQFADSDDYCDPEGDFAATCRRGAAAITALAASEARVKTLTEALGRLLAAQSDLFQIDDADAEEEYHDAVKEARAALKEAGHE